MKKMKILNYSLNEKIDELRKIKHDYGSQISYINGLHIMKEYDRLNGVLKRIINNHKSVETNVKKISNSSSIIGIIIKSIDFKDINVISEENADLSKTNISEYDLHRIISNIVKNAITAMEGKGLIVVSTAEVLNKIYISIKNDWPKIDDNIISSIFKKGFTTKNTSENGLGLFIVKELVEIKGGDILVKSNNEFTEFAI